MNLDINSGAFLRVGFKEDSLLLFLNLPLRHLPLPLPGKNTDNFGTLADCCGIRIPLRPLMVILT